MLSPKKRRGKRVGWEGQQTPETKETGDPARIKRLETEEKSTAEQSHGAEEERE